MQLDFTPRWPASEHSYLVRYYRALAQGRFTEALRKAMLFDIVCMSDFRVAA